MSGLDERLVREIQRLADLLSVLVEVKNVKRPNQTVPRIAPPSDSPAARWEGGYPKPPPFGDDTRGSLWHSRIRN